MSMYYTRTGGRGYMTCLCQWFNDLIDGMSGVMSLPFKGRLSILRFE